MYSVVKPIELSQKLSNVGQNIHWCTLGGSDLTEALRNQALAADQSKVTEVLGECETTLLTQSVCPIFLRVEILNILRSWRMGTVGSGGNVCGPISRSEIALGSIHKSCQHDDVELAQMPITYTLLHRMKSLWFEISPEWSATCSMYHVEKCQLKQNNAQNTEYLIYLLCLWTTDQLGLGCRQILLAFLVR